MSDSDAPLFSELTSQRLRERPELDASAEEPLGLKNPLLPARSLGLNQRFLVPLGAQSLSVLDASIFQSDGIQRDFLDSPFQDSPFFADVDPIFVPVSMPTSSSEQQAQGKRDEVSQSEKWGQRSPDEIHHSTSKPNIQRSQDTTFAPSFDNISKSPNQPQQSTDQSNDSLLNSDSMQQVNLSEKNQPSFSDASQVDQSQPNIQSLQSEPEIQLSSEKTSIAPSKNISETLIQLQKITSPSNELELNAKPEDQVTSSQSIQISTSDENKAQIPKTSQSSNQEIQSSQEKSSQAISFKQSSDSSIQPQKLPIQSNSSEIDNSALQQISSSEDSQLRATDEINLNTLQSIIQPSRSLSPSEHSALDSAQPVHSVETTESQSISELQTSKSEQIVPSNDSLPAQDFSTYPEVVAPSAESSVNPAPLIESENIQLKTIPLNIENEIIQPKEIAANNSANDEILTNIDNTSQQSVSNAIASPLPLDSIVTKISTSQLENDESVPQQPPISVQEQIVETKKIELKLTDTIQKKEPRETDILSRKTQESAIMPTIQTAEESAIAPKFDIQSIENSEITQPSLDSISTEPNRLSESALPTSSWLEIVPTIQPQLAENDAEEIGRLATIPSPSSETLEVIETNARSLSEQAIFLQPATQEFSPTSLENLSIDERLPSDSLDQPIVNSTSSPPPDTLVEPTQPALEATRFVLQQQPKSITDTADNQLSLLQRSPIAEQFSSEEILFASETVTEPPATAIESLSEVNPMVSRAIDLSFEIANANGIEIEPVSLKIPLENQAELLQLKALTELAASLGTNAQVSNSSQTLNELSDTRSNLQAQETASSQISVDAIQQISTSVDDCTELEIKYSQNRLEHAQASSEDKQVTPENAIASLNPVIQELQIDSNESVQKISEAVVNQPVIPTETTEISCRVSNQNFPEAITEQSSPIDLNTSEIVDLVAPKDSLQASASIHEPSMIHVSKSALLFGNASTQAPIEQSEITEAQVTQPIQRSPQSFLNQSNSTTANLIVNLEATPADETLSQFTQDDTFQSLNTVNQTNLSSEIESTSDETIQRTIQQSEIESANIEENTQQEIQKSQPQVDDKQTRLEPLIQRSPTLENTAIAAPTQPQSIQAETNELLTPQSDSTIVEQRGLSFIHQNTEPQIIAPSVDQEIDLKRDRPVEADSVNLTQPNIIPDIITEQPKLDIQPPSLHPSTHPFDVASIPEKPLQRSLESLAPKIDDSVIKPSPESIPQVPRVLQNLTVLRSLTQPQPLSGSDATVQAKSLESQPLQATPVQAKSLQATGTITLPLVSSASPTANVPAASSIEQSVLNRKPEPVKVASTSSDLSRQWSTLNELVQGQTVPSRRTSVAKTASSQKPSTKATSSTIQAKFAESSTPVRVTRQTSPTIRREGDQFQDEDSDDSDHLEALAQAIYDRLRQRMRIEQERHGRDYSGRLPW